jgi:hypothetical protein
MILLLLLKDTDWLIELINKIQLFAAYNTPHLQRNTKTDSERTENYIPSKWNLEASRSSCIHIQQRRL